MQKYLIQINIVAYLILITVNILAIKLPFFGRTPEMVSDLYPNLLTPQDFTFKIWSLVYLMLGVFTFMALRYFNNETGKIPKEVSRIGLLFLISCILNFMWLMSWQSLHIATAFLIILILWVVLIIINYRLTKLEGARWFSTIPFSIYLAWICVATLANMNVLLIDSGFDFFALSEELWTSILIGIGICGTLLVLYLNGDVWFTAVLIWAFFGIYIKNSRLSVDNDLVINTSLFAMLLLITIGIIVGIKNWKKSQKVLMPQ